MVSLNSTIADLGLTYFVIISFMVNHSDLVKQWFILKTAFSKPFLWWIACYLKKNLYCERCDHQHFMSEGQRKNLEFLAGFKPMGRLTEEQGQILESFISKLKVSPPFFISTQCHPNNKQDMYHVNLVYCGLFLCLCNSVDRAPTCCSGGHRLESCYGHKIFFLVPHL